MNDLWMIMDGRIEGGKQDTQKAGKQESRQERKRWMD